MKKNEIKKNKYDILYEKINSFRKFLIPFIIVMIPIIFLLFILNVHGYIFPDLLNGKTIFRLDIFYRYCFIILAFMYLYQIIYEINHNENNIHFTDYALFVFMAFTVFSTISSVDIEIGLYGFPYRYEGMFTLLFYGFLYLNTKLLKDRKHIIWCISIILFDVFIQLIPSILQEVGWFQKIIFMYDVNDITGFTENANFLGSIMCTLSILSLSYFLIYKKNYYYLLTFIVAYIVLLMANSSGPYLSFAFTLILMIIYALIKKLKIWKRLLICIVLIVGIYPLVLNGNDKITPEIKSNFNYLFNLIKIDTKDNNTDKEKDNNNQTDVAPINPSSEIDTVNKLGNGRIRIWRNVLKSVKKKPFIGYGPDNLGLVYERSVDDSAIADKAHNIYLHILVSSGLFALLGYLVWAISLCIKALKSKDSLINALVFAVIAYSVQGFFNINVSEVTPYFYLLIGLMAALININDLKEIKK